jgi:hypothetical protein
MQKTVLVSQSFGKDSELRRVVFAILSAFAFLKNEDRDIQVVLFSDKPAFFTKWFAGINYKIIELTPDKIKHMRGDIDFLHRMKIALIEESFNLFPGHDMFYFDSDTFFIENPALGINRINADTSSMHLHEYQFTYTKDIPLPGGQTFQAFYQLINATEFKMNDGTLLKVNSTDSSWNAGVMCLHHSHARFLPDVYSLTNQFYPPTLNHASEQYAFSILLQKNTHLTSCDDIVYHYWYKVKKMIMDEVLSKTSFSQLEALTLDKKLIQIRKMVAWLPNHFEKHYETLMDNAIVAFNADDYSSGYVNYAKAFFKSPIKALSHLSDVLYHTKRKFAQKNNNDE